MLRTLCKKLSENKNAIAIAVLFLAALLSIFVATPKLPGLVLFGTPFKA